MNSYTVLLKPQIFILRNGSQQADPVLFFLFLSQNVPVNKQWVFPSSNLRVLLSI